MCKSACANVLSKEAEHQQPRRVTWANIMNT